MFNSRKSIIYLAVTTLVVVIAGFSLYGITRTDSSVPPVPSETSTSDTNMLTATFAGGCFWCTEAALQETEGVSSAVSGYAGGTEVNPTYEQVYKEQTSHREAVQVKYNPSIVTFEELLDVFWRGIDPTDSGGQFVDRGLSYTTAIFYHDESQKQLAENSAQNLTDAGKYDSIIVTQILPFSTFYQAEEYHQDFYLKSPARYEQYKSLSGRDEYKAKVWEEIQKSTEE